MASFLCSRRRLATNAYMLSAAVDVYNWAKRMLLDAGLPPRHLFHSSEGLKVHPYSEPLQDRILPLVF
jgi:hypothetical protein